MLITGMPVWMNGQPELSRRRVARPTMPSVGLPSPVLCTGPASFLYPLPRQKATAHVLLPVDSGSFWLWSQPPTNGQWLGCLVISYFLIGVVHQWPFFELWLMGHICKLSKGFCFGFGFLPSEFHFFHLFFFCSLCASCQMVQLNLIMIVNISGKDTEKKRLEEFLHLALIKAVTHRFAGQVSWTSTQSQDAGYIYIEKLKRPLHHQLLMFTAWGNCRSIPLSSEYVGNKSEPIHSLWANKR